MNQIKCLFVDIGGVLLTNGWDHQERENALRHFALDAAEFNPLHDKYYPLHETGKMSLDEYLDKVVFWKKREFSLQEFKNFMFSQSKPHPEMLAWMNELKQNIPLKIVAVSNEGHDLAMYRITQFHLHAFMDAFFISCFVGYRKPDLEIYKMALNVMQMAPEDVFYIDDRPQLVDTAAQLGIHGVVHTSLETTREKLLALQA